MSRCLVNRCVSVTVAFCIGLFVSGCTTVSVDPQAQVETLEIMPDNFEQCRQQLIDWANDGNIYAASKLCDMGLWWPMREIDLENLSQWSGSTQKIGCRTAQQVYAIILSNRSYYLKPWTGYLQDLRWSQKMLSMDPAEDALVLFQRMMAEHLLDSSYDASMDLETLYPLMESQKPSVSKSLELARWHLSRSITELVLCKDPDLEQVVLHAKEAEQLLKKYDYKEGLIASYFNQAFAIMPSKYNSSGDWAMALELFEEGAGLAKAIGCEKIVAFSLFWQARCLDPRDGDLGRAIALCNESLSIYTAEGDEARRGHPLLTLAGLLRPEANPDGDWNTSAELYAEAAKALALADDSAWYLGICLHEQAYCLVPDNNTDGNWLEAAELYAEASQIFQEIGDEEYEEDCKEWARYCAASAFGL